MTEPTDALADVVARIAAPTHEPDQPGPTDSPAVTGELRRLHAWWRVVGGGEPLTSVEVPCPPGTIADGIAAADRAIDAGATLLIPRVAHRDDRAARTVFALLTRREASSVVHQPAGMTDRAWMTDVAAVRDAVSTSTELRGEPERLAADLGSSGIATAVGVLLGSAARRTPSIVDGTDELAAALIADRLCYRAKGWWWPGSSSPDPGRTVAVDRLDVEPGLPLGLWDDTGLGARATLALLSLAVDARVAE